MRQKDNRPTVNREQHSGQYSFGERIAYHHRAFSESLKSHTMAPGWPAVLRRQLSSRSQWTNRLSRLVGGLSRKINEAFQAVALFRDPLDMVLLKRPFAWATKGLTAQVGPHADWPLRGPDDTRAGGLPALRQGAESTGYSAAFPEAGRRPPEPDFARPDESVGTVAGGMPAGAPAFISRAPWLVSVRRDRLHRASQQVSSARTPQSRVPAFAHGDLAEESRPGSTGPLLVDSASDGLYSAGRPTDLLSVASDSRLAGAGHAASSLPHRPVEHASGADDYRPVKSTDAELSQSDAGASHPSDTEVAGGQGQQHHRATDSTGRASAAGHTAPHLPSPLAASEDGLSAEHHIPSGKKPTGDLFLAERTEEHPDHRAGARQRTSGETAARIPVFEPVAVNPAARPTAWLSVAGRREAAASPVAPRWVRTESLHRQMPVIDTDFTRTMTDRHRTGGSLRRPSMTSPLFMTTPTGETGVGPAIARARLLPAGGHPVQTADRAHQHEETDDRSGGGLPASSIPRPELALDHGQDRPQQAAQSEAERTVTGSIEGITPTASSSRTTMLSSPEDIASSRERGLVPPDPQHKRTETQPRTPSVSINQGHEPDKSGSRSSIEEHPRQTVSPAPVQARQKSQPLGALLVRDSLSPSAGRILRSGESIGRSAAGMAAALFGSPVISGADGIPVPYGVSPYRVSASGNAPLTAHEAVARSIHRRYRTDETIALSPLEKPLPSIGRLDVTPPDTMVPTEPVEISGSANDDTESANQLDTEALAREVYTILKRQFAVERERLGAGVR